MKLKREEMVVILKNRLDELMRYHIPSITNYDYITEQIEEVWQEIKNDIKERLPKKQ